MADLQYVKIEDNVYTIDDYNSVTGPDGATENNVPVFDGATGRLIKDSGLKLESKAAASSGTALSMVTTGEKYTWNNKATNSVATSSANGLMSSEDKAKLDAINGINVYYVEGSTSDAEGVWTGTITGLTEYYDGLTVLYRPKVAGASGGTTLNINNLGAKVCYMSSSTKLTTHYNTYAVVLFTYSGGYWRRADYNSDNNTRMNVYTQDTGYNGDYPVLVGRDTLETYTAKANGEATTSYGLVYKTNAPTLNPSTGVMTLKGLTVTDKITGSITGDAGTVNGHTVAVNVPSTAVFTSKSAASGGTALSMVTTGEKYTWNNKASTSAATSSANGLMPKEDKAKIDEMGMVSFGICTTDAGESAKIVTLSNTSWQLKTGSIIGVRFNNSNTASNVTLNVNGTGAKNIWYSSAMYTGSSANVVGTANRTTFFMYDGVYWMWLNMGIIATNTTNSAGAADNPDTKMFLVGRTAQSTGTSYSNSKVYIGTDNCLYSNGAKVITDISGKVNVNQGTTHAGKFLMVNSSGNVVPTAILNANGVSF